MVGNRARFGGQKARAAEAARVDLKSLSLIAGRAHQADGAAVSNKLGQLRIIAVPQREHVVVAADDDGLPPPVTGRLLGDDEVARRDLIPASRQSAGDWCAGVVV